MKLAFRWITLANRNYFLYLNRALAPYGLNSSQYQFILNLFLHPGITQDKLPELICINRSNVARALAQLEKNGLIRREVNQEDKRTATVFLTERGRELYPQIMGVIQEWDDAVTEVFSEQENDALLDLVRRLAGRAAELRDATPHTLRK